MEEIKTLPEVAKRVFLDCKKCEVGRFHVVLAHKTKTSAKVECEVCKKKGTFKLTKPKKATAGKKKSTRVTKTPGAKQLDKFTDLKDKYGSGNLHPYKMTVTFTVNSAIDHPKFGVGIITEVAKQSIQVTFQDEDRALVHGRG